MASKTTIEMDAGENETATVFVFDRRRGNAPEKKIQLAGLFNYEAFKLRIIKEFNLTEKDHFVIVTTTRQEVTNETYDTLVEDKDTLYLLFNVKQELSAPAQERVDYQPHYDTLVKSGMYEYYASEGQNPLPFAFAELIDNSLAATSNNVGTRRIELKLFFDDSMGKNMIVVCDNGQGMTSKALQNWAVYRLSKFIRRDRTAEKNMDGESSNQVIMPRSLNSDISYFGVGGKQAAFFIGCSTVMISKPKGSKDVHELTVSKEEFERRERMRESIYSGYIHNRKPGDISHVPPESKHMQNLIKEELGQESFTNIAISGIENRHIQYLKMDFKGWCKQLAHIYHYYIHGPKGNEERSLSSHQRAPSPFKNLDIDITLYEKGKPPKEQNLRDIDTDQQTQFIRSSPESFEFRAKVEGTGIVEGILRYHPFLYDKETYPSSTSYRSVDNEETSLDEELEFYIQDRPARGNRPIFECFWNGRLIPYTFVQDFDWCAPPKKRGPIPVECFNRLSGVLWTNDMFQVSTNKLTFSDLEVRLRDNNTIFEKVIAGLPQRANIDKEFTEWLKECHRKLDKQIKFSGYSGKTTRKDLPLKRQSPWAVYKNIEWDGKVFKQGQLMRTTRTNPIIYGSIQRFMLFGDYNEDVFATGGDVEVRQEPAMLYDMVKSFPLSKLDRVIPDRQCKKFIDDESGKLPERLMVSWPEGFDVQPNEKRPAGKKIGAIQIEILNRNGDAISKLPGSQHSSKRLLVELKIILHASTRDEEIVSYISQYGKKWTSYWFRKMENIKALGNYTLKLQCVMNESNAESFGGKPLPSHKIKFAVVEGPPTKFSVGMLEPPFRVGVPFNIPLKVHDKFGNQTKPTSDLTPVLEASGITVEYDTTVVKGTTLLIKDVKAIACVDSPLGKDYSFNITLPSLVDSPCETMKFRLLPGWPSLIHVSNRQDEEIELENGKPVLFNVEIHDAAGNITVQPKLNVVCKFLGAGSLPTYNADCSNTGKGTLSGNILFIKNIKKPQKITARIELSNFKNVPAFEQSITIIPSCQPCFLDVFFTKPDGKLEKLLPLQELNRTAGEHITDLMFALFDEGKRHLTMTKELADKIKVSWLPRFNKDLLLEGRLPNLKVPDSILDPKYCEVSLSDGSGVEFSFTVKPNAGEAALLKATAKGPKSVRLGEVWEGEIIVSVTDQHSNPIKKLPHGALSQLEVTSENLNPRQLQRALLQNVGFVLKNIRFTGDTLGQREITLTYCGLTDYVKLTIDPGLPSKLKFVHFTPAEPIILHSESWFGKPISLQLTDESGNPPSYINVKASLNPSSGLQLGSSAKPNVACDKNGIIDFGDYKVMSGIGTYKLSVKVLIGKTNIVSPTLTVKVLPDPMRPVSLDVTYTEKKILAGGILPDFCVTVLTEDKGNLQNVNVKSFTMVIRHAQCLSGVCYSSDPRKAADENRFAYFRNRKAPEASGPCKITFQYSSKYNNQNVVISSQELKFTVIAGPPAKLVTNASQLTPTVSNSPRADRRVLVSSLQLNLQDEFNNPAGEDINGKVSVTVCSSVSDTDEGDDSEMPCLDQSASNMTFTMTKGRALIENVTVEANTPGKDGVEYVVKMAVTSSKLSNKVKPFCQPFLFYNDARKQSRMAALSRDRDDLISHIKAYKELFDTIDQLVKEMKNANAEAVEVETQTKRELQKMGLSAQQIRSDVSITRLISDLTKKKDSFLKKPRRKCGLENVVIGDSMTIGKIGHLAEVEDNDIARILSWHLGGDMDCVITKTTTRAKEIYDKSNGSQQVLPLDSIFKRNLPDWNKPLPHVKFKISNNPPGNPIYARHLLKFPGSEEECKLVFLMLLGNTIVLDSLNDANKYRMELIKYAHCPTLLTRDGSRVQSNGKFGGNQNRALPLERMRGAVFGAPVSQEYQNICNQIEKLTFLKAAVAKRSETQLELKEAEARRNDSDVKTQMRECQEAEEQLVTIEEKLGMTSSSTITTNGRGRPAPKGPSETTNQQDPLRRRLNNTSSPSLRTSSRRSAGGPSGASPETKRRR
ncbi:structural maintenance of chromosomes flexible hinge domain-containing protein 1-like [Antedon mediterranea]|uniref:structural maintenance of chromosomes flexible hinge domain-containing protein 1-like n=1 Tax=Antedon mediterranea TaxID=105859 RepID=UPI003AF735C2